MKKTLIATAVAASVMAPISAHAINFSADGTGEVLLYPYYNVNQGNATFIGVANTTAEVKVLKVRFREGVESEDVLDFQVWLSPYDHWTAVMSQEGSAVRINTSDTSCTVPSLASGASLLSNRINAAYTGDVLDRLSEGHIEIIEMATVFPSNNVTTANLTYAVTHIGGTPPNCAGVSSFNGSPTTFAFTPGQTVVNGLEGRFEEPTGGIYGIAAVFNPTDGTYFTYSAEALQNFAATPIFLAQRSLDATAFLQNFTADDLVIAEHGLKFFDLPDLSTPDLFEFNGTNTQVIAYIYGGNNSSGNCTGGPATCITQATYNVAPKPTDAKRNAVTAALQGASVTNDFLTGGLYDTDWVFTFPGKYMFREIPGAGATIAPDYPFDLGGNPAGTLGGPFTVPVTRTSGQACEPVSINGPVGIRDREEAKTSQDDVGFSPGIAETFNLCYEVNVVSINDDAGGAYSGALASSAVWQQASGWPTYGFAELGFDQFMIDSNQVTHAGLPFMGFAAIADRITDVTRGGTFMHKVVRGLQP
jgi:hypothetical protein